MIIAIDGPAASGKGSLAKLLAELYGLKHVDTGKFYRLIAFELNKQNPNMDFSTLEISEEHIQKICDHIEESDLEDARLKDESVGKMASIIAKNQRVRELVVAAQRRFTQKMARNFKGAILDGRDIGTAVFPDADYKFFLTASLEARAKRRYQELGDADYSQAEILAMLKQRDDNDMNRKIAPLKAAESSFHLDSSNLTIEEMVAAAKNYIDSEKKLAE